MEIDIQGKFAIVKKTNTNDLLFLIERLTFVSKNLVIPAEKRVNQIPYMPYGEIPKDKDIELPFTSLLFRNAQNEFYFYTNILQTLSQFSELNIQYDKSKLPALNKPEFSVDPEILGNITLRDYQVSSINKILRHNSGVFLGATGFGKTAVIIALIKFYLEKGLIKKCLIVTPNLAITDNMIARFTSHNLDELVAGAGGKFKFSPKPIIVGNVNTVYKSVHLEVGHLYEHIKDVDMIIYDECHHASAYTSFRVATKLAPKYLYGFSGTPYRQEGYIHCYEDGLIHSLFGPTMVNVPTRYLIKRGYLAQPYIFMKEIGKRSKFFNSTYKSVYDDFILKNKHRNQCIADYAKLFIKAGLRTLILVQRINHIDMLLELLKDYNVLGVSGSNTGKLIDSVTGMVEQFDCSYEQAWSDLNTGKYDAVIASVVADEGVDIPTVGALIIGGSGKSIIRAYQRTGRGLRSKSEGANMVFVLDFNDLGHAFVHSHSKQRLKHYEDMGAIMVNEAQFLQMVMETNKQPEAE